MPIFRIHPKCKTSKQAARREQRIIYAPDSNSNSNEWPIWPDLEFWIRKVSSSVCCCRCRSVTLVVVVVIDPIWLLALLMMISRLSTTCGPWFSPTSPERTLRDTLRDGRGFISISQGAMEALASYRSRQVVSHCSRWWHYSLEIPLTKRRWKTNANNWTWPVHWPLL